jgi:hypothetical protein
MEVEMEDTAVPASPPEMNLLQRVWGILVSPRQTLESLRDHPRVLGAILILVVINVLGTLALGDLIAQSQADRMQGRPNVTQEQIDKAGQITRITAPVFAAIGIPIVVFVVAGVYFFIGNVILGGDGRYKQMAAGTAYASMVLIPSYIVRVPLALAKHDVRVQTSLAALMSPDASTTVPYHVLSQFDIFNLWGLALGVLVVAVMARLDVKKAAIGVVTAWVIWSAIMVVLQSVIPGFGQM